jgi:hypothetical protein
MHGLFHVVVLVTTLLGAAGGVLLVLAALALDEAPAGLARVRPAIAALVVAAALLLLAEWLLVH